MHFMDNISEDLVPKLKYCVHLTARGLVGLIIMFIQQNALLNYFLHCSVELWSLTKFLYTYIVSTLTEYGVKYLAILSCLQLAIGIF